MEARFRSIRRPNMFIAAALIALFPAFAPNALGFEAAFGDARTAVGVGPLNSGDVAYVLMLTTDLGVESLSPPDPPTVSPPADALYTVVLIGNATISDIGYALIPSGTTLALQPPPLGPLWMDPLLHQATWTITLPSLYFSGGTITVNVTITGDGDYYPLVGLPSPPEGLPGSIGGWGLLGRIGTVAGSVSSSATGLGGAFDGPNLAILTESAGVSVSVP